MSPVNIPWLDATSPFPEPHTALGPNSGLAGLLAAGADLSTQRLISAYRQGIFPWFSEGQPILWWSTDPRMVLEVADFKLHRSLRKTLSQFSQSSDCEIRINHAFEQVIQRCASIKRVGQPGTWIGPEMVIAYQALHEAGFAHSVETWVDNALVGGLYCVAIGQSVFGESMFAQQSDASKIAFAGLIAFCRQHGITMIDCQQNTRHLASLGAKEIPRGDFLQRIAHQQNLPSPQWRFESIYWQKLLPPRQT